MAPAPELTFAVAVVVAWPSAVIVPGESDIDTFAVGGMTTIAWAVSEASK